MIDTLACAVIKIRKVEYLSQFAVEPGRNTTFIH